MLLAAGLYPDRMGELKCSHRPPSHNQGRASASKRNGERRGMKRREGRG